MGTIKIAADFTQMRQIADQLMEVTSTLEDCSQNATGIAFSMDTILNGESGSEFVAQFAVLSERYHSLIHSVESFADFICECADRYEDCDEWLYRQIAQI